MDKICSIDVCNDTLNVERRERELVVRRVSRRAIALTSNKGMI
jgi:hypothetical protein